MIIERLDKGPVLGDGGAIFELERRGYVSAGPFTPEVVLEHPDVVRQMQIDFARAGAEVLQAVTYYAHEDKLRVRGLADKVDELNASAVRIAREAAAENDCLVAGNLSNTWVYDPEDPSSHAETRRQFDQQITAQASAGVDFFIAETFGYLGEALLAIEAIHAAGKVAMITMGFKYNDKTIEQIALEEAFARLEQAGAEIVGINCFRDPERTLPLAARVRRTVFCHVATQPVAYRCTDENPYFQAQRHAGRVAFPLEMDPLTLSRVEMAEYAAAALTLGVNFIGSCCGAGPHHVRAMAEALGRTPPNGRYSPHLEQHPIIGSDDFRREKDRRIIDEQRGG